MTGEICKDCETEMTWKFTIVVSHWITTEIWQCSKCKRIDAFSTNDE